MPKRALVLGGYGLIGSACMRTLVDAGFQVTGMGRSRPAALAADQSAEWVIRDMTKVTASDWHKLLTGVDVVVNASGALQDGGRDDLEAIHVTAIKHLVAGVEGLPVRIVQISAAGVSTDASTRFFRTKARGDDIIAAQASNWVILRPTLVLSPDAYGGTALLRAVAALPYVLPSVFPDAQVQSVYIGDVASAVKAAALDQVPSGTIADLTEHETRSFPELVLSVRRWQGWPPPRCSPRLPDFILRAAGRFADALGALGWRSPLRTTALNALRDGIKGDPTTWEDSGGAVCQSLDATLSQLPATRQERLFARAFFALPIGIGVLSLFWILSGVIALLQPSQAFAVLEQRDVADWLVSPVVFGGALVDVLLGLLILWRPWAKRAASGMLVVSVAYLLGGAIVAPDLWSDHLGPMVKVFPGLALAAFVWLLLEDR